MALARALAVEPRVLLLDEPFGGSTHRSARSCAGGSGTCTRRSTSPRVFVTHDQEEAMQVADRIAVMNKGCDRAGWEARATFTRIPSTGS